MSDLATHIRDVPDFPKPGIVFKDITPLLRDASALQAAISDLGTPYRDARIDAVAAMESRGFIFGAAVARDLQCGFVPLRKPGKLPWRCRREEYELEYGTAALEVHEDAFAAGERVLLIDDLLATGGTTAAACKLVRDAGAEVVAAAFVIELSFLHGRARLDCPVSALIEYS